jgi:protein tyrosine phosphatase (PTP) superfamily phosphohydrolase (DUF442 family)
LKLKEKFEKFDDNWRAELARSFSDGNQRSAERHAFWIDHEFLRVFYHNDFEIAPGVYRSNQPSERRIYEWREKKGVKTIINFRGVSNQGAFLIEKNVCRKAKIDLINLKFYSSKLPEKEKIFALEKIFKKINGPFLMHCKSGSDRAGLGSALFFLLVLDSPIEVAQSQLSFRYLHLGGWTAGILDFMLMQFRLANKTKGIKFLDWIEEDYDVASLTESYKNFRKNSSFLKVPR